MIKLIKGGAALVITIPLLLVTNSCNKTVEPVTIEPVMEWSLIWQDEFDGLAGQRPDPTKWGYDIGTDWGNAQLEYDTDRPANVSLDGDGNLAIIARKESYLNRDYTSARIVTRDLFDYEELEQKRLNPSYIEFFRKP